MRTSIKLEDGKLAVRFPYSPVLVEYVASMDQRARWRPDWSGGKAWIFPMEGFLLAKLCNLLGLDLRSTAHGMASQMMDHGASPDEVLDFIERLIGKEEPRKPVDLSRLEGFEFITTPYAHQRVGVLELADNRSWLLAWEMRTGKCKTVVDAVRFLGLRKILIVCPKSVLSVWAREFKLHGNMDIITISGTQAQKIKALNETAFRLGAIRFEADCQRPAIVVTNYETIVNYTRSLTEPWDAIVADETQRQKNSTTVTSKAMRRIAAVSERRWALSGTPAPNSPLDWQGTLLFLDPSGGIAGTTLKGVFQSRYALTSSLPDQPNVKIVVGFQNLEDLHKRVRSCSSRVTQADCADLPPKVFSERYCQLEGEQRRVYRELKKDAVTKLKTMKKEGVLTARNILTEALRLQQVVSGAVQDDDGHCHHLEPDAKMALFREVVGDLPEDKRFVVWCSFRADITKISEWLSSEGYAVGVITGDTSSADREKVISDFQAGSLQVFVGMVQAAGEGIDLSAADTMVYYSRTYSLPHWLQSQARCDNLRLKRSVLVLCLVAQDTLDEKITSSLARKEALQESMMRSDPEEWL